jgi:hypothetical protein
MARPIKGFVARTDNYVVAGAPFKPGFGLAVPADAKYWWGFRGIQEFGSFSLLPDRQDHKTDPAIKEKTFFSVVNKLVMPSLRRKVSEDIAVGGDDRFYHFNFETKLGLLVAVIWPRAGYIYGCVYLPR